MLGGVAQQISGAIPFFARSVIGVVEPAGAQRQAAAPDTSVQIIPEFLQSLDPRVEVSAKRTTDPFPITLVWCATLWQAIQDRPNIGDAKVELLGDPHKTEPANVGPSKLAMTTGVAQRVHKFHFLIVSDGGHGQTRAFGYIPNWK